MQVSVKEIQAAGGLDKWQQKMLRQQSQSTPQPQESPEQWVERRLADQIAEQEKPKRKRTNRQREKCASEHDEQVELLKWWNGCSKNRWKLPQSVLFANANGGYRPIQSAMKLKMEGVRAGVPDLTLAVPSRGKHGLYIEMKRRVGGVLSMPQANFIKTLEKMGYACAVCEGCNEAIKAITEYLGE